VEDHDADHGWCVAVSHRDTHHAMDAVSQLGPEHVFVAVGIGCVIHLGR